MKVKIDTKERFHAITLPGNSLSATVTEELEASLLPYLQNDVKNIVLILKDIQNIDIAAAEKLVSIQHELLELMNVTPSESEAWDIVQMEEVEREFLGGEDG